VFVIGLDNCYLAPAGAATRSAQVRREIGQEVGIDDRALTKTRANQRVFLTSIS
jgi:hypothetical protein